jgi:hypothetical protein
MKYDGLSLEVLLTSPYVAGVFGDDWEDIRAEIVGDLAERFPGVEARFVAELPPDSPDALQIIIQDEQRTLSDVAREEVKRAVWESLHAQAIKRMARRVREMNQRLEVMHQDLGVARKEIRAARADVRDSILSVREAHETAAIIRQAKGEMAPA